MPQPFTVDLELALSGKGAPPQAGYDQALAKSAAALDWLRQQHDSKSLELLGIPTLAQHHAAVPVKDADVESPASHRRELLSDDRSCD